MNYTYPVDLTCDDDDDAGTVPVVAPPAAVTRIRVPVVNTDVVDLTDSPLPQLGPRKADALKPTSNRITDYFSPSPASPTKKIKTEHVGTIVLDDLTPSPLVKSEQSRSSGASRGPSPTQRFFTALKAMSTNSADSTGTSKDSFRTAADGDTSNTHMGRLVSSGGQTPSSSFCRANTNHGPNSINLTSPPPKVPSPVRTTQQDIQPFNISDSLEMPSIATVQVVTSHPSVPPSVSVDEQQTLEIQVDCEMDISPLRPEPEYTPMVSMVTPVASVAQASEENTPSHPAAKRMKVEEPAPVVTAPPAQKEAKVNATKPQPSPEPAPAPVPTPHVPAPVPCAEQIDTTLRQMQSVIMPLAALLDELSPGPSSKDKNKDNTKTSSTEGEPRDELSQHSSLTASVAPGGVAPSAARARTTKPAADDEMQTKKLAHIQRVLFPSHLFAEKPAEISQTGVVLHIVQETLRKNFNSPGVMSYITRALKDSPPRVYLLLIDAKLKALRSLTASRNTERSARHDPEVFGLGKWSHLRSLLSKLFHLPDANEEDNADIGAPHSNHSSGEKSARGGGGGGDFNTSSNATSGVVSKSSQRRAKNTQKAAVLGIIPSTTTDESDPAPKPHHHGVHKIHAGASKVRTEMDARRVVAETESAECALGLRILDTWGDYFDHIARYYAHAEKKNALSDANKDKLYDLCVELAEFSAQVRTSLDVPSIIMGPARKNKSKDMDTIAERDVKRAAGKLEDLAARAHNLFVTCADSADENSMFVRDVLDLEAQLQTPAQWAEERAEDAPQYEKYTQDLLAKAWPLLDGALRPWSVGALSKTAVRYSVTQLQCILARMMRNLSDIEARGVVLKGLDETAALRRVLTNLTRVLGRVMSNTKVLLYARAPSAAGLPPVSAVPAVSETSAEVGILLRLSALSDTIDVLVSAGAGAAATTSKKRSDGDALVELVDHMRQHCSIELSV